MAGFLTHLVQRTLAASPALAPRLAGRYEARREALHSPWPPDVQSPTGSAHDAPEAAREQAEAPVPAVRAERDTRAQRAPVFAAGERQHEPESTPAPVVRHASEATESRPVQVSDGPPSATPFPDGHAAAPVPRTPAPQATVESSSARLRNAVPQVAPLQPPALQPQPGPRPDPPRHEAGTRAPHGIASNDARPAPVADGRASRGSVVPTIGSGGLQEPHVQTGMLVEPPPASDGPGHREPQQATAAPTVHVTIGRIELRAAAPAPASAPARSAARAPALSLSDYLERRAKTGAP